MEEMKRTSHAKLEGKRNDKTSLNYRFTVHLAGRFLFSFKNYVKCEISNDHFAICIFILTSDSRSFCGFNIYSAASESMAF